MGRAYIGTSGWQYSNWQGSFYPQDLPTSRWFTFYTKYFDTVEVNSSFYHQTKATTFQKWQKVTASNFVFTVKGHRFVTHIKRLKECNEALKVFFDNVSVLSGRHIILWQLPPSLKQDLARLSAFLNLLPIRFKHAIEFRHRSWVNRETWEVLRKYNVGAVFQDWREWPKIREVTADFVYFRFHGNKILYTSKYTDEELSGWADVIKKYLREGKDVYAYFNNDSACFAVSNAITLKNLVAGL